jgi:hypothetical protein
MAMTVRHAVSRGDYKAVPLFSPVHHGGSGRTFQSSEPLPVVALRKPVPASALENDVLNAPLTRGWALVTNGDGLGITGQNLVAMSVAIIIHDPAAESWGVGDLELAKDGKKLVALLA